MRLFSSHKIGTKTVRRGTASPPVLTRYKLLSIERLSSLLQTRTRLHRVECAYAELVWRGKVSFFFINPQYSLARIYPMQCAALQVHGKSPYCSIPYP